ncbi:MAG: PhnD/SsuA/transferrin family substrate-binding protein [Bryobacterales bacterium]|nr:PhnD/SsuA/transferrin family substrate-binding protein [Bryobacterales bacterium]
MSPAVVFLLLALTVGHALSQGPAARKPARMFVMASQSLFAGVNRNDAAAALRVWVEALGRRRGFDFELKMDIFSAPSEAAERLQAASVDLLILDTPDYAALAGRKLIEPVASGSDRGKAGAFEYLLLAREGSQLQTWHDLGNKRIAVSSRTGANMGLAWADTALSGLRIASPASFFASVTVAAKPSACVLPVFFGKLDACIVDRYGFDLMKELNPQLGRLKVIARSEPVVEGMIAFPMERHRNREELIESVYELHKDPAGAQMVILFRSGPLIPATAAVFDTARSIWEKSLRLDTASARLASGAAFKKDVR